MTPMLRELHEARKARLPRMGARQYQNAIVPLHRVRPIPEPVAVQPQPEPEVEEPKLTPFEEIEPPVILKNTSVTIRQIQIVVAKRYKVSLQAINSDTRYQSVMLPRQISYTLARRLTNKALTTIGPAFNRDHTTVMQGIRKIEKRARKDAEFAAELTQLEQVIMGKKDLPCPCCGSLTPTRPDDNSGDAQADNS
jgi:hypothetical protein